MEVLVAVDGIGESEGFDRGAVSSGETSARSDDFVSGIDSSISPLRCKLLFGWGEGWVKTDVHGCSMLPLPRSLSLAR